MEKPVPKTWKPMAAGILNLTVGTFDLLGTMSLIIAVFAVGTADLFLEQDIYPMTMSFIDAILIVMTIYLAVVGILAIIGGIYALQRRKWGLALTGSIAATLSCGVLGIASVVFMAISKDEFA